MSMSKERKKAQDKLRRKYGYSTNNNYGRGTVLYKQCPDTITRDGNKYVEDMNIVMNHNIHWNPTSPIQVYTSEYQDNGEKSPPGKRYEPISEHLILLSLEELDLIHTVAHQMALEYDWEGQAKKQK